MRKAQFESNSSSSWKDTLHRKTPFYDMFSYDMFSTRLHNSFSILPKLVLITLLCFVGSAAQMTTCAQELPHNHDHDKPAQQELIDYKPQTEKLTKAILAFKTQLKTLRAAQVMYHNCDDKAQEAKYRREWYEALSPMYDLNAELIQAAVEEFQADPNSRVDLGQILFKTLKRNCDKDIYDGMLPIAKLLFEMQHPSPDIPQMYLQCCLAANDFKQAQDPIRSKSMSIANPAAMLTQLEQLQADWEAELKARERDAAGEPLPQVKINTTKGQVIVELFENDAPEAVANFISLVEQGFYDYSDFFFVGDRTLAQTGCPNEDGTGGPGYWITSERSLPNARGLFRGSLALAQLPHNPNTGGSIFFIPYLPAITQENNYTVFGRVVSGMHAIGNLNRIKPARKDESEEDKKKPKLDPDEIINMEIIRKRDHKYEPKKLPIVRPQ